MHRTGAAAGAEGEMDFVRALDTRGALRRNKVDARLNMTDELCLYLYGKC
jgi:hypothetical protein